MTVFRLTATPLRVALGWLIVTVNGVTTVGEKRGGLQRELATSHVVSTAK